MAKRVYAVKEIKKLMGRTADASAPTAMGGAAILGAKAHALAGPEHTGQLPTTRLSTAETDTALVAAPDGSGGVEFRVETNPMTTLDDIIVGGASGAPGRLGKGTDGQVLTVDPTTHHLIWATPGSGGGVTVQDEGTPLATVADTIDFVGAGVVASGTGTTKTITISGASVADILDLPTAETTTTKVLAPDGAGGVEFRAESGGAGAVTYPLDAPPGTPHALDDEFPGPSLDGKWTDPTTSAAGQTNIIGFATPGWISLAPVSASKHVFGIRQAVSAGSFSVAGKFLELGGGSDIRSGIFVGIAGGKGHVCGPFLQDNQVGVIGVTAVSNTADWSGYDGYLGNFGGASIPITWVRIRWNASTSTLYFDWSQNGVVWRNGTSRAGMSQPDQVGFAIYSNSGAITTAEIIMLDWFRVTNSAAF